MKVEVIQFLTLGNSEIHHIMEDKTEIIDLGIKGEPKWNEFLDYINNYCNKNNFEIKDIENSRVWIVSDK